MDHSYEEINPAPNDLDLVQVLTTSEPDRVHLASLILSAADIPHTISADRAGRSVILASSAFASRAKTEISEYDQENLDWPRQPPQTEAFNPYFRVQAILIVMSLMLFYAVTGPWTVHSPWFSHGAVDAERILDHADYIRLMTGLTLHADLVHLLGNCLLGGFLLHFYFLLIGNGIGLFALLTTSCLANYLNVLAHGSGHHSVGFSTAVFAVIGILSALNYRHHRFTRPERLILPLMAGAAMLAMLGSGDETGRTDLGAHFFGLMAGLCTGTLLGFDRIYRLRHHLKIQLILTVLSWSSVVIGWQIALR